jgi:hypothetical protein
MRHRRRVRSRLKIRMEGLENELRNRNLYEYELRDKISELQFELRRLQTEVTNHWVMIIEAEVNHIYHFEGADAQRLAKIAFANNVQPKKVVSIAKLIEWSGDYKKAGKQIIGGEIRSGKNSTVSKYLIDDPTKLIELR